MHLVGGAVRDLLLGRPPRELDVIVEGDVGELAERASAAGAGAVAHERFGTATVRDGDCRWDLAAARAETYARPGALPDVRPAGIEQDLQRRDVTVNALALDLATGELRAAPHAHEDLARRPAARPARRELRRRPHAPVADRALRGTARLRPRGAHGGARARRPSAPAPSRPSPAPGSATSCASRSPSPTRSRRSRRAVALGLAPWLAPDRALTERALALLPAGEGRRDLLVLAAALAAPADALLADLQFSAAERAIVRAAAEAPALDDDAPRAPSELARALRGRPVEAVALAGARGGAAGAAAARRWLEELRHVGLQITGDDLRAAGIAEGADLGRRLQAVLDLRLDGALAADRDAQLAAALAIAPGASTAGSA